MIEKHKMNWSKEFKDHGSSNENQWGNPERRDKFGDYRYISEWVMCATYNQVIVDIGTFTGKWLQFMSHAKTVWCVDIIDDAFGFVSDRFPAMDLRFYKTPGNDLKDIPDNSVDIVFSMDALMRAEIADINAYLKEAYRVLKPGGRTFIHVPCISIPECRERGFTEFDSSTIIAKKNQWRGMWLDRSLTKHGVLVRALK